MKFIAYNQCANCMVDLTNPEPVILEIEIADHDWPQPDICTVCNDQYGKFIRMLEDEEAMEGI